VKTHLFALGDSDVGTLQLADGREIYVTSLERTVLDCARLLRLNEAAIIGDHALRKGADLPSLEFDGKGKYSDFGPPTRCCWPNAPARTP
jgi:hypothetical protein